MKASKLISKLQAMIDKYGDKEIEVYDNTICPVKAKRVSYVNAQDWVHDSKEKVFRIRQ